MQLPSTLQDCASFLHRRTIFSALALGKVCIEFSWLLKTFSRRPQPHPLICLDFALCHFDYELLFIDTELHGLDFVFVFTNHLLIDSKCIEKHYRHSHMVFCRPSKCSSAKLKSTGEQIKMLNMTIRVHDNFLIAPHPRLLHYSSSSRLRIFW